MPFNKAKSKTILDKIRSLPGCEDVRANDISGMPEVYAQALLSGKITKIAIHGTGQQFSLDRTDPYNTSDKVNFNGGEMGGRWRGNFPFDRSHIGEDEDTQKNLKGTGEDLDENLRGETVNEAMEEGVTGYVIHIPTDGPEESKQVARDLGLECDVQHREVIVTLNDVGEAQSIMKSKPRAVIERIRT